MKFNKIIEAENNYKINNENFNTLENNFNKVNEDLYNFDKIIDDIYFDIVGNKEQEAKDKLMNLKKDVSKTINTNMRDLWDEMVNLAYK